jgi:glycosidase
MRSHPHLYEINTWPWLDALSRRYGRELTLGAVPDETWDALADLGIDLVYLMGVWRRSAIGRQLARSDPRMFPAYDLALPGWRARDVVGSAYSIAAHALDPRLGTWDDVDKAREKLHARGMRLVVDFIPNHTGFDHPWVVDHPNRYITLSEEQFRRDPSAARPIETASGDVRFVVCGRDPYFPPWDDVAQLNYFDADLRAAMIGELASIAQHADGARCDMAMLVLSDVFAGTWGATVGAQPPRTEFWRDARAAVPGFVLLAEVYWDREWQLQQLGFDYTYDKALYDRLLTGSAADVRGHLGASEDYQRRSARFIENHDESRSVVAFGDRVRAAAVVTTTIQGLRFFHDGQFEGRRARLPVQLGVAPDEPIDDRLLAFYRRLLAITGADIFHDAQWRLIEIFSAGDETDVNLVAWRWRSSGDLRIVAVNLGEGLAEGHLRVNADLPDGAALVFQDLLTGIGYRWDRSALYSNGGLYVRLEGGQAQIFSVAPAG